MYFGCNQFVLEVFVFALSEGGESFTYKRM